MKWRHKMNKRKKILLIYNQKAGISGNMNDLFQCIEYLSVHGYEVTLFPIVPKKRLTSERIIEQTKGEYNQYFICGGDGTLNHVVNGMLQHDVHVPIAYVPVGSTNDFSKSLYGTKAHTFLDVCKFITHGKQFIFDVGKFDNTYFNYVAGFGAFPTVSYKTPQNIKNKLGYVAYILNFLATIPDGLTYCKHCKITHDGIVDEGDFMFGLITNSISVAGTQPGVIKQSSLNDGVFEVILIKANPSPIEVADMVTSVNGNKTHVNGVVTFQTKQATFEFDDLVPWTLDGEDGGTVRKAEISIIPERISVFVPR